MSCRLCDAPYNDDALDFIKCEECPVMICERCDDKRNFMRNCPDAVSRCAVCQKLWDLRQEVGEPQQKPSVCQDQQIQHLESYTPSATPDVPDRPVLVIQEMIRMQQTGERPLSPSTEVTDILYSA